MFRRRRWRQPLAADRLDMMFPRPTVATPGLGSTWRFEGRVRSLRRTEPAGAFRERLIAALRAAHGLGVKLDLGLVSSPDPVATLGCSTPAGARWATRILSTAYGRASWTRQSAPTVTPAEPLLWGRRVRAWPDPLRDVADGASITDTARLTLSAVPPGVALRWSFSPSRATWGRPPELAATGLGSPSVRPPRRVADPRVPVARTDVPVPSRDSPLFWRSSVSLALPAGLTQEPTRGNAKSAVEAALRSGSGNGVRFSHRWPLPFPRIPWFPVSTEELASILPGPEGEGPTGASTVAPGVPVLPLGRSMTGRVVGPGVEPTQGRHLAVLGETGMGKSSTLVAVALKASTLGGVVLFDPLGETARAFRSELSERDRSRLIWVAPDEPRCAINALEGIGRTDENPVLSDRRLNDLVHALRRVRSGRYADSAYWGPRLEEMLTRALRAAGSWAGGTLVDAHTLLATGGRTRQVVPSSAHEDVRELSDRVRERPDDAEGARRLLYEVVRSPVLLRMLCERDPPRHVKDLVEPGRIGIISGEASEVGESVARYLLAVYLALVWSELLARESRTKTFVVLDEAQWFSHESLAEMLRLARRRNVHVVLATQTIGSLPEVVRESVWTNVADFVAFRGSPEEARELSRAAPGVSVEEVLALPRGHAAVLLGKGSSVEWLRTAGRPPSPEAEVPRDRTECRTPSRDVREPDPPPDRSLGNVDRVLAWMREKASSLPAGGILRIELAELRGTVDPEGQALRQAGARLGRAGALLRAERSGSGSVWVVDPSRIPLGNGSGGATSPSEDAERPQPS